MTVETEPGRIGSMSPAAYRELLARARVSPDDIERSANSLPTTTTASSETSVTTTVKLSKTVCACRERAIALGIDPESFIMDATVAALGEGRHKVGMFGRAGEIINNLRTKIGQSEERAYAAAAARRR